MPSTAFGVVLGGFLLVYAEALRPGLIIPGVLGLVAILSGFFAWFLFHPSPLGVALLCLAAMLFIAESRHGIRLVAGFFASTFVVWGAVTLFSGQERISTLFAVSAGLPFSCVTLWLANAAHQARRNKRHPELD